MATKMRDNMSPARVSLAATGSVPALSDVSAAPPNI
jgi:hypothetical protein